MKIPFGVWNYAAELLFWLPMSGPETDWGRLAVVLVLLVVLFGAALGSKWLIVSTNWGIWAVLLALVIIALGFVIVNWRGKFK
ncbi:hypothetical protein [Taklimakanibacter lacteus]|uniref:hypothetical protein n=1 Tax=Taklimakanibacter lacteus TaxID=2268456 RepID=UPI000E660133